MHGGLSVGAAVSGEADSVGFDLSAGASDADVSTATSPVTMRCPTKPGYSPATPPFKQN